MTDNLITIAKQFKPKSQIFNIQQHGSGNINSTFLVTIHNQQPFILQKLNTSIFCQPKLVMDNICILSDYVQEKLRHYSLPANRRWLFPQVLLTENQQNYWLAEDDSFWRAISFIDNSKSFDTIQDLNHGREIGYGLGMFHSLFNDLAVEKLADTLEGFHITPGYLRHYEKIIDNCKIDQLRHCPEINYCLKFISDRPQLPHILETAKQAAKLKLRIIHGDPKINNLMIDCSTQQAVAMIDLDTVKPGLIHYDIGDCLRSGCNPLGEETDKWQEVTFEPELAQAILQGYLKVAQDFLTENDYEFVYDSIRLLAFELGLRFFTDYLQHNVYFNVDYPEHNLARALVQFKLTESIERQATTIQNLVNDLR